MRFSIVLLALLIVAAAGFLAGRAVCRHGHAELSDDEGASLPEKLSVAVEHFIRTTQTSGQPLPPDVSVRELVALGLLRQEDIRISEHLDLRVSISAGERAPTQQTNPAEETKTTIHTTPMQTSLTSPTRYLVQTAATVVLATLIHSNAVAQGAVEAAAIKVLSEKTQKFVEKTLRSTFSEHERVYPVFDNRTFLIPAGDFGGTRISVNFDHRSWVPRGSKPVKVRFTVHGVDDTIRSAIRVHMKADKQGRTDRDRGPGLLHHGSELNLEYGTSGDRAYYFVERDSPINGQHLPRGAYFRLDRLD